MSEKELRGVEVLGRVGAGELKLSKAARLLGVSYRQAKRLWRRYRQQGPAGLQHGNAGRRSNRAKPEKLRRRALQLVRRHYGGEPGERFGPTLAAEHLAEDHGVVLGRETLRRWMLAAGLWSRERKRKAYRKRRERKPHFGEMVQLDGSFEDWLEGRGPRGCLMNMVDDATSTTWSQLGAEETTWAAATVLRSWVEEYGIPQSLYTDWKNVYVREPTARERLQGIIPLTQFGRMCAELGIRIIAANSPQAKGRVERSHGIHQDRLIKKMRLRNICGVEEANRYLQQQYLPEHNRRFAWAPASPEDFHRPVPAGLDLDWVFRLQEERVISNDWVVRYKGRLLQIQRQSRCYAPARSKVTVCEWPGGWVKIFYRGQEVNWEQIPALPSRQSSPALARPAVRHHRPPPPGPDHPWRKSLRQRRPSSRAPDGRGALQPGALWK